MPGSPTHLQLPCRSHTFREALFSSLGLSSWSPTLAHYKHAARSYVESAGEIFLLLLPAVACWHSALSQLQVLLGTVSLSLASGLCLPNSLTALWLRQVPLGTVMPHTSVTESLLAVLCPVVVCPGTPGCVSTVPREGQAGGHHLSSFK